MREASTHVPHQVEAGGLVVHASAREANVGDEAEQVGRELLAEHHGLLPGGGQQDLGTTAHAQSTLLSAETVLHHGAHQVENAGVQQGQVARVELNVVLDEHDHGHMATLGVQPHIQSVLHGLDHGQNEAAVALPDERPAPQARIGGALLLPAARLVHIHATGGVHTRVQQRKLPLVGGQQHHGHVLHAAQKAPHRRGVHADEAQYQVPALRRVG
mmetsp:Transcript_16545/g.49549  ORF Transcript_16545/g.49549 Transcript_16545/m.49549 type:complete len:215 (+) Transcript_16545:596-1240(+)